MNEIQIMQIAFLSGMAGVIILSIALNHIVCKRVREERDEALIDKGRAYRKIEEAHKKRLGAEKERLTIWEKNLDLNAERSEVRKRYKELSKEKEDLVKDKAALEAELEASQKRHQEKSSQLKVNKKEVYILENEIAELKMKIEELEGEIKSREGEMKRVLKTISLWKGKNATISELYGIIEKMQREAEESGIAHLKESAKAVLKSRENLERAKLIANASESPCLTSSKKPKTITTTKYKAVSGSAREIDFEEDDDNENSLIPVNAKVSA